MDIIQHLHIINNNKTKTYPNFCRSSCWIFETSTDGYEGQLENSEKYCLQEHADCSTAGQQYFISTQELKVSDNTWIFLSLLLSFERRSD